MGKTKNKNKSPLIFFLISLALIVIIMFNAKHKSILKNEIRMPFNNGISNITTHKNLLIAVSLDNKIYVCDWNNLSKEPQSGLVQSGQAALLKEDFVISLQKKPNAIVATNLKGDKKFKEIFLETSKTPTFLETNSQGNTIAVLLADSQQQPVQIYYELNTIELEAERVNQIANEKTDATKLYAMAISNNGQLVAIVGDKNGQGWIEVFNVKQKQKLLETTLPQSTPFLSVAFAKDDKTIFTGGRDSTLYKIKTDGELLTRLIPPNTEADNTQPVQHIAVSSDGRLVAANAGDFVNIWEIESGKNIFSRHPGHKITSGVVFSPDGRLLATSDLRQGETIKIWRIP
jgi:WD40 repeat protein